MTESRTSQLIDTIVAARLVLVPPVFVAAALLYTFLGSRTVSENVAIVFAILTYGVGAFDVAEIYRNSRAEYKLIAIRRYVVVIGLLPVKLYFAWLGNLELVLIIQGVEAAMWQVVLVPFSRKTLESCLRALRRLSEGAREIWELKSLWLSGITSVLATRADVYVVAAYVGVAQLGQYSTASRFVEAASIVAVAATTVIFNDLARAANTARDYATKSRSSARQMLGLSTLCTLALATFGPFLVVLLYGREFQSAAELIPLYSLTLIPLFQRQLISKILVIERQYRLSLISNVVGLALNLLMNFLLVPHLGVWGAVISAVSSYILTILVSFAPTRKGRKILTISIGAVAMNDRSLTEACSEMIDVRRRSSDEQEANTAQTRRVEA
jgi:O-antigen/teichoic acid export membrane protein